MSESLHSSEYLSKQLIKLLHRIERIMIPPNTIIHSTIGSRIGDLCKKIKGQEFFEEIKLIGVGGGGGSRSSVGNGTKKGSNKQSGHQNHNSKESTGCKKVDWVKLEKEIVIAIADGVEDGFVVPTEVCNEIDDEKRVQYLELMKLQGKQRLSSIQERNGQPVVAGPWRKKPFTRRSYEHIDDYVFTRSIPESEAAELSELLNTPLDGFLGQAYNYDDHTLTENWMCAFDDREANSASEDDVIKTQIESLMDIMVAQVTDRVCNTTGVLKREPMQLGEGLKETPVWGIDCYTRRMIELSISDGLADEVNASVDPEIVRVFVERKVLPTINALPQESAHSMRAVMNAIVDPSSCASTRDRQFASFVLKSIDELGQEEFKIHPKGTGVICSREEGIPPHVVVAHYLGEIYPPYRWCERIEVVQQAQQEYKLKPTLPDFYNILLERPRQDPAGYGLFYVDAAQRANHGSSCSHSCNSNCTSAVVAKNGKLVIVLTTVRRVHFGEELTMDYNSITTSDMEWRAAVCLCGMSSCRGSFLHYATQDDLQQVLNLKCGPLTRFASLMRSVAREPKGEDLEALNRHGFKEAALGKDVPSWVKKYCADALRFIEFERTALPCALMRPRDGQSSLYTFSSADMDARCVMEQRIQSLLCCVSLVRRVLAKQPEHLRHRPPLKMLPAEAAVKRVLDSLRTIPALLRKYVLEGFRSAEASSSGKGRGTKSGQLESYLTLRPQDRERVSEVSADIDAMLQEALLGESLHVQGTRFMKQKCLEVRELIKKISDLSTPTARLALLCDVLALWAFTSNFSTIEAFEPVESDPIVVPARELGTNIPRSKVFVPEVTSARLKRDSTSVTSATAPSIVKTVYQDFMSVIESATNEARSLANKRQKLDDRPADIADSSDILSVVIDIKDESSFDSPASGEDDHAQASDITLCLVPSPAESAVTSRESLLSLRSDPSTPSFVDSDPSTFDALNDVQESIAGCESGADAYDASENGDTSQHNISLPTSTAVKDVSGDHHKSAYRHILDPNEPVFTGCKRYPGHYVFWQLMAWFNAGTDEKECAPDILGCVKLPTPNMCFGESESQYGAAERGCLLAHLSDDKAQILPWPLKLKKCFSEDASNENELLLGSPMMDTALGLVEATQLALAVIEPSPRPTMRRFTQDNGQYDDYLPPEDPTEWVQCEACDKWRRLPWYMDLTSLPDKWVCEMNSWDKESAYCAYPSDNFDPVRESTLQYSEASEAVELAVGEWRDVFCTKNQVFYEAKILKIRDIPASRVPTELADGTFSRSKREALFHFKGWGSSFDEWIDEYSDRICLHYSHTNPAASKPREQEYWQGFSLTEASTNNSASKSSKLTQKADKQRNIVKIEVSTPNVDASSGKRKKSLTAKVPKRSKPTEGTAATKSKKRTKEDRGSSSKPSTPRVRYASESPNVRIFELEDGTDDESVELTELCLPVLKSDAKPNALQSNSWRVKFVQGSRLLDSQIIDSWPECTLLEVQEIFKMGAPVQVDQSNIDTATNESDLNDIGDNQLLLPSGVEFVEDDSRSVIADSITTHVD